VIIEPASPQQLVVEGETQRFDEMQMASSVGAQTDDIAGVRSDLRMNQDNVHAGEQYRITT